MRLLFSFKLIIMITLTGAYLSASPSLAATSTTNTRQGESAGRIESDRDDGLEKHDVPERPYSLAGRISAISGWSIFGAAYIATAVTGGVVMAGGDSGEWGLLFIPVVGPAILSGMLLNSDKESESDEWGELLAVMLLLPTLAQTVGATLLTVGHVLCYRHKKRLREQTFAISLTPTMRGKGARLGFGMRF